MSARLNLEQQRKRAKDLRRALRAGDGAAAEAVLRHLPRLRGRSPSDAQAAALSLAEAQLVVARQAGFASWPQLKAAIAGDLGAAIVDAALAGDEARVATLRARDPAVATRALPVAAVLGDPAALQLLAADPTSAARPAGRRAWPPLLYLCCSRHRPEDAALNAARLEIARALLAHGADPNATGVDPDFTTDNLAVVFEHVWHPLEGAARLRHRALLELLLAAGATTQATGLLGAAVASGDPEILARVLELPWRWWQIGRALAQATERDDAIMVRQLLARDAAPLTVEKALLTAIRLHRGVPLIALLLGERSEPRRALYATAYRAAMRHGHPGACQLLRAQGADPAQLGPADRAIAAAMIGDAVALRAELPLHQALQIDDHRMLSWAVRTGRAHAVALLLDAGLDPTLPDADGDTPVHLAARAAAPAMLAELLARGGRANGRNFDGQTPLELARALPPSPARARVMAALEAAGATPAAPDRDLAALFESAADAVVAGDLATLRALLDREPALVHARSPRPHRATLLHYCGANGVEQFRQVTPPNAPAVAQLLLDRGAEVDALTRCYGHAETPLYLMMTSAGPEDARVDGALTRVFARAGARLDWGDQDGPMIWAIDGGRERCALALAEAGLRLDNLLFAAAANRVDVLADLLARGAEVNTRYWQGYTALHAAAVMGHAEAVAFLLARGADPALRELKYGDTAADKARWRQHPAVVALLEAN